ncbi:MAG: helix-turn-helix domain-containing protein [Planctomycetes bacterium]|nr:helix-turn-helix domain-containing protein [Planctomycetota bacterium]
MTPPLPNPPDPDRLLDHLGRRIRTTRETLGITRRELAERSEVSERFLADVERGIGNPSILRLAQIAHALGTRPEAFLATAPLTRTFPVVALLGLRGAGKSSVGGVLAARLNCRFVELDARIETNVGMALPEVFEVHGESYYRDAERDTLSQVLDEMGPTVLATGGGLVTVPETFGLLRSRAHTVWLRARPEDHWNRVLAQGDTRPMEGNERAFTHLRHLLETRERLYVLAEHQVDTAHRSVDDLADELARTYDHLASPGTSC